MKNTLPLLLSMVFFLAPPCLVAMMGRSQMGVGSSLLQGKQSAYRYGSIIKDAGCEEDRNTETYFPLHNVNPTETRFQEESSNQEANVVFIIDAPKPFIDLVNEQELAKINYFYDLAFHTNNAPNFVLYREGSLLAVRASRDLNNNNDAGIIWEFFLLVLEKHMEQK